MFAKENLVQFLAGAGCFSVLQMLLLVTLGAILSSTTHYHELLGNGIQQAGGGMILTGMLYSPAAVLGIYSGRTQNKFLLLLLFILLLLLIFLQSVLGAVTVGPTQSVYSHAEQVACLTVGRYDGMTPAQQKQCDSFFASDLFAGMSLVWFSYFSKSPTDGSTRSLVLSIQKNNFCCGNGLPLHCVNDSRAFPSSYPSTDISIQRGQRRECAVVKDYYLPTSECKNGNRCQYDLPYGACGSNPVTLTTRGCAAYMFQSLSRQVKVMGILVLVMLVFPIVFLIVSLCLCFKRRDQDVLPHVGFVSKVRVYAES